ARKRDQPGHTQELYQEEDAKRIKRRNSGGYPKSNEAEKEERYSWDIKNKGRDVKHPGLLCDYPVLNRNKLCFFELLSNCIPVYYAPESSDIIRTSVLIFQVVSMFPYVHT